MPGSKGLLLKCSTSSYRKQHPIRFVLWYSTRLLRIDYSYQVPDSVDSQQKKYQEQPGFCLHSSEVVVLDLKLHHPRSLPSSILTDQLFPDTRIQAIPEPAMAEFFASSSQTRLLPQSTYFASERQFAREVGKSDSRRLVFYSIQATSSSPRW